MIDIKKLINGVINLMIVLKTMIKNIDEVIIKLSFEKLSNFCLSLMKLKVETVFILKLTLPRVE